MNALDIFIERGNTQSAPVIGETFTWASAEYVGTVSDLVKDEFFADDGIGSKLNAERLLECAVSVFGGGGMPQIKDTITYLAVIYQITEIESQDTTNIVWKIREKMGVAT
jgi:hypothetical protein